MKSNLQIYNNVAIKDYALHDNVGVHKNSEEYAGSSNTAVGTNPGKYNTT